MDDATGGGTRASTRPGRSRPLSHGVAVVTAVSTAFWIWTRTGAGGETLVEAVDDLATVAAAGVAAVLCATAAARQEGRRALSWWLLAGACCAWVLGETLWASYDFTRREVPVPSWADLGYLAALPLATAALLVHPALRGRRLGKTRSLADGLAIAAAVFFLAWALVLEPLQRTTDLASLRGAVTVAYPLGDLVIVVLVVLVIRDTTSADRSALWCLLAGLLAITLSDAVYGYLTAVREYATGNLIDVGWFAGYLAIALGALRARADETPRQGSTPSLTRAAVVTPFLPMLAALGFAALRIQLGRKLDTTSLLTVAALVAVVLVRQSLLAFDLIASRGTPDGVAERLRRALGEAARDEPAAGARGRECSP